jgi:hypothetical protein
MVRANRSTLEPEGQSEKRIRIRIRKRTLLDTCLAKLRQIENQARDDRQGDIQEIADASTLYSLYLEQKIYLGATLRLPVLRDRLEHLGFYANNLDCEPGDDARDAAVAEQTIREWNAGLPEWKRLYHATRTRILARPTSKLKGFLVEEEEAPPTSETPPSEAVP